MPALVLLLVSCTLILCTYPVGWLGLFLLFVWLMHVQDRVQEQAQDRQRIRDALWFTNNTFTDLPGGKVRMGSKILAWDRVHDRIIIID